MLLKNKQRKKRKIKATTIIKIIGVVFAIGVLVYLVGNSMIPVNVDHIVFLAPTNVYLKAINSADNGYYFASQSTKGSRNPSSGINSPTYHVSKDSLVSIHLINEDTNIPNALSTHNINIDEFNVHSKDLHYFQTQTITFLADKKGEFEYYCSIHPEMRGTIVVK